MSKNILVTGCCGFLGSHFVESLIEKGNKVVGIDCLLPTANFNHIERMQANENFLFINASIGNSTSLKKVFNLVSPDIVFNCAGEARENVSRELIVERNILDIDKLFQACIDYNVPIVHLSTSEVYGQNTEKEIRFDEKSEINPTTFLSWSKASSDILFKNYEKKGLLGNIVRISKVFGPRQFPDNFIPKVIISLISGQKIKLQKGELNQKNQWMFVEDAVENIIALSEEEAWGETYNLCGEEIIKNSEVIENFVKDSNIEDLVEYSEESCGYMNNEIFCQKIKDCLSESYFNTKSTFVENLDKTAKYYQKEIQKAIEQKR